MWFVGFQKLFIYTTYDYLTKSYIIIQLGESKSH